MPSAGPIELAVLWVHTDGPAVPAVVADATAPGGRVVQVFGTRVWPLDPVPVHVAYRQVLLGSIGGRWLTNTEISDGVLAAIDADEPVRVVGDRAWASSPVEKSTHNRHRFRLRAFTRCSLSAAGPPVGVSAVV